MDRLHDAVYEFVIDIFTIFSGAYKVPYSPPPLKGREVYQGCRKEYQVMKRGMEYHGCGEEYNIEKGKAEAMLSSL